MTDTDSSPREDINNRTETRKAGYETMVVRAATEEVTADADVAGLKMGDVRRE